MHHPFIARVLLFLLLATPLASADDAPLKLASGSAAVRQEGETDVVMRSECVRIYLGKEEAIVDATFDFFNEGETTTITVGFPFYGMGYVWHPDESDFTGARLGHFETWVNEQPCAFEEVAGEMELTEFKKNGDETTVITDSRRIEEIRRTIVQQGLPESSFVHETRWLAKEVTFPANQTTTTRVRYFADYCRSEVNMFEYLYGTGAGWKGPIGKATFIVTSSPEMWLEDWPFTQSKEDSYRKRTDYERNRIDEFTHEFVFNKLNPEKDAVFTLFANDRFQLFLSPWGPLDCPMSERPITTDDLDLLSLHQLRLFENYYLAIHGRKLTNPKLKAELVEKCDVPESDVQKTNLTPKERDNIKKIRAYAKKLRKRFPISSSPAAASSISSVTSSEVQ